MNLTQKLMTSHLVSGDMTPGAEIALHIDQTLTQDALGTLCYLQFEAMGVPRVRTKLSVSYVDHQLLQADFRNADDHAYLQDIAAQYGIYYSRPGNGICHQVHLQRFASPGDTLLGTGLHPPPSSASRRPATRSSAPTVTRRPAAVWGCWPSAPAGWMWPSPWPAAPMSC